MKKLLFIAILLPVIASAQINKDTVNVSDEINFMKTCFSEHNKEFSFGTVIFCAGVGLGAVTTVMDVTSGEKKALYVGSSIIAFGGSLVMIHSNRYFKKASLGLNCNGISVKYRFK